MRKLICGDGGFEGGNMVMVVLMGCDGGDKVMVVLMGCDGGLVGKLRPSEQLTDGRKD